MNSTWRWTIALTNDGHRFKGGEWRCADCRRTAFDLIEHRWPCMSPTVDSGYLFVGGPLDGQWIHIPNAVKTWTVPIPEPTPRIVTDDGPGPEVVHYVLKKRDDKPILAYVYEG